MGVARVEAVGLVAMRAAADTAAAMAAARVAAVRAMGKMVVAVRAAARVVGTWERVKRGAQVAARVAKAHLGGVGGGGAVGEAVAVMASAKAEEVAQVPEGEVRGGWAGRLAEEQGAPASNARPKARAARGAG